MIADRHIGTQGCCNQTDNACACSDIQHPRAFLDSALHMCCQSESRCTQSGIVQ